MKTSEAITQFRNSAIEKGDFAEPKADAALHRAMTEAVQVLESSDDGIQAMRSLLNDNREEVSGWIAAHFLAMGDTSAIEVLKRIAAGKGLRAFSASMTLREYDHGRLQSPFQGKKKKA